MGENLLEPESEIQMQIGQEKGREEQRMERPEDCEISDAIRHVIEECINDNIMSQFLSEHREAVMKASLVEYNEQDEREGILLDGIDKGREEQRIEDEKIIAEKDACIAEKDATITQTNTELAQTRERIKELEAQVAALKKA